MSRAIRSEAALSEILARPGYRVATQFGAEVVNTTSGASDFAPAQSDDARGCASRRIVAGTQSGPLTLPWPPSGNTAVRHAQGAHYLNPLVIAYRDSVASLCARFKPTAGRYRLHVHLSPPDARRRDADNALKSLLDALVKAGYLVDDSLTYMRELIVTVDDERRNVVRVRAIPYDIEGIPR